MLMLMVVVTMMRVGFWEGHISFSMNVFLGIFSFMAISPAIAASLPPPGSSSAPPGSTRSGADDGHINLIGIEGRCLRLAKELYSTMLVLRNLIHIVRMVWLHMTNNTHWPASVAICT